MGMDGNAQQILSVILSIIGATSMCLLIDQMRETRPARLLMHPVRTTNPRLVIGFVKDVNDMETQLNRLAAMPSGERWHFTGMFYDALGKPGQRLSVAVYNDDWLRRQAIVTAK